MAFALLLSSRLLWRCAAVCKREPLGPHRILNRARELHAHIADTGEQASFQLLGLLPEGGVPDVKSSQCHESVPIEDLENSIELVGQK